jgi:hypothetical protein
VVEAAAGGRLPQESALAEAIRRRRATGGPAERTFATLVGLELRPRRLREAAEIWRLLTQERGINGREAVWSHPDLLPTTDDLDDPAGFVRGRPELNMADFDEALDELTGGEPGTAAPETGEPGAGKPGEDGPGGDGGEDAGSGQPGGH